MCAKHRPIINARLRRTINGASRVDPSRTTVLRARFIQQMNKRLTLLKRDISTSIVDNDCFGFKDALTTQMAATPGQFKFMRDPQKIAAFMDWLKRQEELGILEIINRPFSAAGIESAWTDMYIKAAYKRGIQRAQAELERLDIPIPSTPGASLEVKAEGAFKAAAHADRVGALYTRTFEELKTVTQIMNMAIQRTVSDGLRTGLARGLAEGLGPGQIARNLVKDIANRVDVIGITRAKMIARTEVIRAHHVGNIAEYRRANANMNVEVQAEWSALDDACPICADMNGQVFSLDKIEDLIPAHPNCRCVAIPYVKDLIDNSSGRRPASLIGRAA